MMRNLFRALVLAGLLAGLVSVAPAEPATGKALEIPWHQWGPKPFARARQENKLVLIDVGMEGCTACRWMDEGTYRDPRVVRVVREGFIAIQVDSEARPDIGERYSDWAWPATIFLAPNGTQVLALRGNRRPRKFIPVLEELQAKLGAGRLSADEMAPYAAPSRPQTTDLTILRNRVRAQLDGAFDDQRGGWGERTKSTAHAEPLIQLIMRSHISDDRLSRARAEKTLRGMTYQLDPVWGGVFISSAGDWRSIIPEKRTGSQAAALQAFAEGYQLTGEARYLEAARAVDRYLREWMQSEDGTFFTSQEDVAPNLPEGMSAREYYSLDSDEIRRRYGIPLIDHAVYTDLNGRVISGYVRLYEASGEIAFLGTAQRAALALLEQREQPEGWMMQTLKTERVAGDSRMRHHATERRPYLKAQVHFGLALLALHRATGDSYWLDASRMVAAGLRTTLADPRIGGFFAAPRDGTENVAPRRKPLEDNAAAARFFYELWVYTKEDEFRETAEKAIRAAAAPEIVRREGRLVGNLAVALELMTSGYVEFSVVGDARDRRARSLFRAARKVYEPRKILHYEQPGRYPDQGRAVLYICNEQACSVPIYDAATVPAEAEKFRRAG